MVSPAFPLRFNLVTGLKTFKTHGFSRPATQPARRVIPFSRNRPVSPKSLDALVMRQGLITAGQLIDARAAQARSGQRFQTALILTGAMKESELIQCLSKQYKVPGINMDDFDIDPEIRALMPQDLCGAYCSFPVNRAGPYLIVAMRDPSDLFAVDDLRFFTGLCIEPVVSSELSLRRIIARYYPMLKGLYSEQPGQN